MCQTTYLYKPLFVPVTLNSVITSAHILDGDRANGSVRFEIKAPLNAGLDVGMQLLQVRMLLNNLISEIWNISRAL